jgi:hypothetical protein
VLQNIYLLLLLSSYRRETYDATVITTIVVGEGMDTNIYIACLWQVVAFAPKVIIACLRQGFCIRKTW